MTDPKITSRIGFGAAVFNSLGGIAYLIILAVLFPRLGINPSV